MTGTGAYKNGGRWNTPGHYAVYTSGNLSLAMLEVVVHVDDAEAFRKLPYVYHEVTFPQDVIATLEEADLPAGWNNRPESRASQLVGDEWLEKQQSVALAVPSVIVPPELQYVPSYMTYLINPQHPDFGAAVAIGETFDLVWDPRLVKP
ncbi:MAG: RES family NAD+ phosphorylase [Deinococcota bacterium]|jgi:RES domain-containing protein|nr:RES family NAD+ phosphorylase [Deinococcota bacterium]